MVKDPSIHDDVPCIAVRLPHMAGMEIIMKTFQDYAATVMGAIASSIIFTSFVGGAVSDLVSFSANMVTQVSPQERLARMESLKHINPKPEYVQVQ